jgi:ATP-dependent DNA helicase RecQ
MGFDKPDLGFVVHLGAPQSPIAYYQQIGRAGRGVRKAEVLLLPGAEDRDIWAYFASLAFPPEPVVRQVLDALAQASGPMSLPALEPRVDLSRSRLEVVLKVLDVDGAVRRERGGWVGMGERWSYDSDRYAHVADARVAEQQAMLDYQSTDACRMEFLLRKLDDPHAVACGRCDNCTGRVWDTEVSATASAEARDRLRRPGVDIGERRQWPPGMRELGVPVSGKIAEGERADPGRALGRLTDIGWGNRLRVLLGVTAPDEPVPDDVFDACVKVLSSWKWKQRPVAVVTMSSHRRPKLIRSLGERLAGIGRLEYLGEVEIGGGTERRSNSAQRLAGLWHAMRIPEPLADSVQRVGGPILVVDDQIDTGWTMAMASRLLRNAGAPAVLPFALASTT